MNFVTIHVAKSLARQASPCQGLQVQVSHRLQYKWQRHSIKKWIFSFARVHLIVSMMVGYLMLLIVYIHRFQDSRAMDEEGLKDMPKFDKGLQVTYKFHEKSSAEDMSESRSPSQNVRHQVRRTLKTWWTEADNLLLPQSFLSISSSVFDEQRGMSDHLTYCLHAV